MSLTCIAVDDEPYALRLLADNISKVPYLHTVALCNNAFEAMKALQAIKVDLIFIDIQMPGLSGLQFIASLQHKPLVIFITAYKQYALESYDLQVVDYLVKPVSLERFVKACNRARDIHELKQLQQAATKISSPEYFFVASDYSQLKLVFADISWLEGLRDYVRIHLKNSSKPVITRGSLKAIEDQLPRGKFIRIHKSYIIAIDSIIAVRKNSIFIKDQELPVSESFREPVDMLVKKHS